MKTVPSATRVAWEPGVLQTTTTRAPRRFASFIAASVSTVSPDWATATTRVERWITGAR